MSDQGKRPGMDAPVLSKRLRALMEIPGKDAPILGPAPVIWWLGDIHVPNLTDAEINRLQSALQQTLDDERARVWANKAVRWLTTQIALDDRLPRLIDCHDHLDKIVSAGKAFIGLLCHEWQHEAVSEKLSEVELIESYMAIASGGKLQSCLDEVWATIKLADDVKREIKASASKPGDKGDIALDATLRSLVLAATLAGAALTLPSNATLRLNPEASTPFLAFARAAIAIAAERLASALQLRPLTDDEERRAKFVLRGYQSSTLTGRALVDKLRAAKNLVKKAQNDGT